MRPVRTVALVGTGGFGSLWAKALREHDLEVVAVVDPDGDERELARKRYELPDRRAYDGSGFEYLADAAPDLVVDSAPPGRRHERMTQAVRAGAHVLTAKPATVSAALAREVAAVAAANGRIVQVAMQKRYLTAFANLIDLCRSGALGTVGFVGVDVSVDGRFWAPGLQWRSRMELPSLRDGGSHHIDLIRAAVGQEVASVAASSWNPRWSSFDGDADFAATLRFSAGASAHLATRWSRRHGPLRHYFSGFLVEGEHGAAWVEDGRLYSEEVPAPVGEVPPVMDLEDLNARMMGDVLANIAAGRPGCDLGLAAHARTLSVVEAIEASVRAESRRQQVRYR